jgi:hypothetical protein
MRAWTFIILRNLFLSQMRRARFKGEWDDITASKILAAPASQDRHIELGDMQRALMHLPQPQREALILVGAGGFAYEEAAEICGCAVGTIKSRVARGRVALEKPADERQAAVAPPAQDRSRTSRRCRRSWARSTSSAATAGLRRHRARQARQPRAQLFVRRRSDLAVRSRDPARSAREDAGEAAVRIGRADRAAQKRTADGYVFRVDLRLRPSPEVTPIVLPVDAAISLLRIGAAVGARGLHPRPAAPATALGRASSRRSSRSSGGARSISARSTNPADQPPDPRPLCAGPGVRPRLRPQARPRRHPRGRVLRPDPAADPRRPRARAARARDARRARGAAKAGRIDAADAASSPTPTGCCARSSTGCRWSTTARPTACRRSPPRSTMSPGCTASPTAACSICCARTSSAVGALFDGLVGERGERLSNDPDILSTRARRAGFAEPAAARSRIADWRSGKARSLRSPAARGVRGDAAGADRGVRAGADPIGRSTASSDHRRAAVERGQFLPAARGAAGLTEHARRDPGHAPALAEQLARRPELLDGLIDASAFDPAAREELPRASPAAMRDGEDYRRWRSTACGGGSTSAASRSASS